MKNRTNEVRMARHEITRLRQMLEYRRPSRSASETEFIARYIDTIPGVYQDDFGNRILLSPDSKVLIACHTDSVHRAEGKQPVHISRAGVARLAGVSGVPGARRASQAGVRASGVSGAVCASLKGVSGVKGVRRQASGVPGVSNCLGADDAAGVYAALRLIEAGVNATFVFHRDEESGGHGSAWLARHYSAWLETFGICLSLDRRGTRDVIVYQAGGQCASDEFAAGLSAQLGMGHRAADGIFTDSANYTHLIPECSNLSIGYQNEHRENETLDVHYLEAVIQRLAGVDWAKVPVVRKPGQDTWADEAWAIDDAWFTDDDFRRLNDDDGFNALAYYM